MLVPTMLVLTMLMQALVLANVASFLEQPLPAQLLLACPVQRVPAMVLSKRWQPQALQQAHRKTVRLQLRRCYCHAAAA